MMDNISDTDFSVYYPDMRLHPKIVPTTQAGLDELRARPEAMDDILISLNYPNVPTPVLHCPQQKGLTKKVFEYPTQMFRYSQLAGFYLIYAYLICDLAHPIMKDAYLQTYFEYKLYILKF
ncbi:Protein TANC1 [Trichinella spiralis]|uniref:Protein TANC1 n=1 Tax=Trichinella spiralis TaxID=6334 RepID=A0ABR3KED6_TRISP